MTIRHKVSATLIAAAATLGCAALPASADAAPVASSAAPAGVAISGRDGLAAYANVALDAWASYANSGSTTSLNSFVSIRDALATEAARRLGLDAGAMRAAWAKADTSHQVALIAAFTQLGTPYRRNTSKPGVGFDCSGLTTFAWGQAGKVLFRQSGTQIKNAAAVTRETAQAGDLVYYPGHVMLYLGLGNAIIHAPYTGRNVEVAFISKSKVNSVRFGNPIG
ncbi:MAG: NlpC/P60 family protein [Ilumatobacteraceae bacterium]